MSGFDLYEWVKGLRTKSAPARGRGRGGEPPMAADQPPREPTPAWRRLLGLAVAGVVIYGLYFWEVRRVVVPADHVLVLMKKNGSKSLPEGQLIIPSAPDQAKDPAN